MKRFLMASLLTLAAAGSAPAAIITQWDFGTGTFSPNIGAGTTSYVGGVTASGSGFATGVSGSGWNTTTYAAQGAGSGTRGVLFLTSTVGFEDITVSLDHRASGTASRWARFEYTTNGGTSWTPHSNNAGGLSPHDTFYSFNIDLSSLSSVENNPNFGFRVVSIFSPNAFSDGLGNNFLANAAYHRARVSAGSVYGDSGTWRFDNVTINGTAVPEPGSMALIMAIGTVGLVVRSRRAV